MEEPVITETFLRWAYVMALGAAATTLIFSLVNLIINPKSIKQTIIMIVGAAILIVASYSLASDQLLSMPGYEGTGNEPVTLKWAGTALWATYILAAGAVLSILYSEVAKFFK